MTRLQDLPPEVLELVFWSTQDSSASTNCATLLRLQLVCKQFEPIARGVLYRHVKIETPSNGKKLLEALIGSRRERLGDHVRVLEIAAKAFYDSTIFSDLSQDDILRQTPNLVRLDSPVASFAPLADGRQPLAVWPVSLKSIQIAPTWRNWADGGEQYDSDIGAENSVSAANTVALLSSMPATLTSLTIRGTLLAEVPSLPPAPLEHLKSITFDMTATSHKTLEWLTGPSITNRSLRALKVWSCPNVTGDQLLGTTFHCGWHLKEFTYKPSDEGTVTVKFLQEVSMSNRASVPCSRVQYESSGLRQVESDESGKLRKRHTPRFLRLTLGANAANHTIYGILPPTLTHLCVALPTYHVDARLSQVFQTVRTRLPYLIKFELYSQIYFPSPLETIYPRKNRSEKTALRELRLSHVETSRTDLEAIFSVVGSTLYTLAYHHVPALDLSLSTVLSSCKNLRRLELGRTASYQTSAPTFPYLPRLHSLRIHFYSALSPSEVIDALETPRLGGRHLETLELVGKFPGDVVGSCWKDAKLMDKMVRVAKEKGTLFMINGRMIETVGDLWVALMD
ncbi:hypothetical protein JCM16303_006757 [Sporobolomyces ruberrimus]